MAHHLTAHIYSKQKKKRHERNPLFVVSFDPVFSRIVCVYIRCRSECFSFVFLRLSIFFGGGNAKRNSANGKLLKRLIIYELLNLNVWTAYKFEEDVEKKVSSQIFYRLLLSIFHYIYLSFEGS